MHPAPLLPIALFVLAGASFCSGQSKPARIGSASIGAAFAEYPEGCITVFDVRNDRWTRHNPDRCREQFVPASTFKILHSLIAACDYGNHKTSGEPPFWISGDLAISADGQVDFLRRLHGGKLALKKTVMDTVKKLITLEKTDGWTLYGKTGWAQPGGVNIGWFVGWVDTGDNTYFFATNIRSKRTDGFGQAREAITMKVLRQIGAIPQGEARDRE